MVIGIMGFVQLDNNLVESGSLNNDQPDASSVCSNVINPFQGCSLTTLPTVSSLKCSAQLTEAVHISSASSSILFVDSHHTTALIHSLDPWLFIGLSLCGRGVL